MNDRCGDISHGTQLGGGSQVTQLFWAAEDSNILFHQRLVQDLLAFGVSRVPKSCKDASAQTSGCDRCVWRQSCWWPPTQGTGQVHKERQHCRELKKKQEIFEIRMNRRDNLQSETMVFPINVLGVLSIFPEPIQSFRKLQWRTHQIASRVTELAVD